MNRNVERRAEALLGRMLAFDGTTVAITKDGEVTHRFPAALVARVRRVREPKGVVVNLWWRADRGRNLKKGSITLAFTEQQWKAADPIVDDIEMARYEQPG